jgi:hypothetical protein
MDHQQKCAIRWPQRRQCPSIGQQNAALLDLVSPRWQFARIVRKRVVNAHSASAALTM